MDITRVSHALACAFLPVGLCACSADWIALAEENEGATVAKRATTPLAQRKIGVLALKDLSGKKHTLEQVKDDRLVVFAFIGTECPLAKLYAPRLQKLYETYHRSGVAFFAVSSNCQDSVLELNGYTKRHDIRFPVLKDVGNKFADEIGATRTPQVFVLDERRAIRYHGRIDDQYGVGY